MRSPLSRRQRRCLLFFFKGLFTFVFSFFFWVSSIGRSVDRRGRRTHASTIGYSPMYNKKKRKSRPLGRQQLNKSKKKNRQEEETDMTKFYATHDLDFFFLLAQPLAAEKKAPKKREAHEATPPPTRDAQKAKKKIYNKQMKKAISSRPQTLCRRPFFVSLSWGFS